MIFDLAFLLPLVILAFVVLGMAIRILREYERGVVFTLGRFTGVKGPGLVLIVPYVQQMVRVDLRVTVLDVPSQDVITRDNVSVKVNAVVYYRVVESDKAVIQVQNFHQATSELAQTTLRSVLGKHELDELLSERDKMNADIQEILDAQTDTWGIKVANAEGEEQAARKLLEAARVLGEVPEAMQLRYLSTLAAIGTQNSTTIVFPFPTEFSQWLSRLQSAGDRPASPPS